MSPKGQVNVATFQIGPQVQKLGEYFSDMRRRKGGIGVWML
jgi:hypothetical protein